MVLRHLVTNTWWRYIWWRIFGDMDNWWQRYLVTESFGDTDIWWQNFWWRKKQISVDRWKYCLHKKMTGLSLIVESWKNCIWMDTRPESTNITSHARLERIKSPILFATQDKLLITMMCYKSTYMWNYNKILLVECPSVFRYFRKPLSQPPSNVSSCSSLYSI